jgi:hypothetical protein
MTSIGTLSGQFGTNGDLSGGAGPWENVTASRPLTPADNGKFFTNNGAAGTVELTAFANTPPGFTVTLGTTSAQTLAFRLAAGEGSRVGGGGTFPGGVVNAAGTGSTFTIKRTGIAAAEWWVVAQFGPSLTTGP